MAEKKKAKNPRFSDKAIAPLRFPEVDKVVCKGCIYRAKDIGTGDNRVYGAVLGTCDAYPIKPPSILLDGKDCMYYFGDDD